MKLAAAALSLAAISALACSRSPETAVRDLPPSAAQSAASSRPPIPSAPASAVSATPSPPIEGPPPRSWTDPRVIARLADDCRADVTTVEAKDGIPTQPNQVMTCDGWMFEQACVSDPCLQEDERSCRTECSKTCGTCSSECATTCEACKTRCATGDRACREACGASCGKCHGECLAARDRCSSGHCAQVYAECRKVLAAKWKKNRCDDVCTVFVRCADRCSNPPPSKKPQKPQTEDDGSAYEACRQKCRTPAVVTCGANEMLCGEMKFAPELGRKSP